MFQTSSLWCGLVCVGGILVASVGATSTRADDQAAAVDDSVDATGVYDLVSVDGKEVPTTIKHGEANLDVESGTFVIDDKGNCISNILFKAPNGNEVTRKVTATFKQNGAELHMKWHGAGRTIGTVQGDRFTMINEGTKFAYVKQKTADTSKVLSPLDRYLGTWRVVITGSPDAQLELEFRRTLGGRYIQEALKSDGSVVSLRMYLDDPDQQTYRRWGFNATGAPSESAGEWDSSSDRFTWTTEPSAKGVTVVASHQFVDDKTLQWSVEGRDKERQVSFQINGDASRIKTHGSEIEPEDTVD